MFEKITPEAAGISSDEIRRYIEYLNANSLAVHSLLLMRDDKIFTEAYWKPFHKDFCHRQYSQTKSFVGIAVGLLVADGKLSLDDKIVDFFPEKIDDMSALSERIKGQTVRQMLTMTTVGENGSWFLEGDPDRTHLYFNNRKKNRIPGALWKYDSAGSQVLCNLVEKLSGMPLLDYMRERLFSHMGCFETASTLKTPNGDTWGDSAILCTARDMASFATLLLHGGRWQGKQLLDESYVKEATSALVDNTEMEFGHVFSGGYGYQIWGAPRGGFGFVGMGAQITMVIPSKKLILAINSDNQGLTSAYDLIANGFLSFVVDRIKDEPLPEDPAANAALEERVESLELIALKGMQDCPLKEKISGKTYLCEENPLGMTKFSFVFEEDRGEFRYTNAQGDKVLPFGINKNVFGKFPQLGYSDEVGNVPTTNGHMYDDAVSLRFTQDNKLQLKVQIIDKYFGNFLATFAFCGDEAAARFFSFAEFFLEEYKGEFIAKQA